MQVDLIHTLIAVCFFAVMAMIGQIIKRPSRNQSPAQVCL